MTLIDRLTAEMENTGIDMQRDAIESIRNKIDTGYPATKAYAEITHRTQIINKLTGSSWVG